MGRLNYTNRKTEGSKLGQTLAKDLNKRIPPGTGSKAALRDPIVELDVTGKALGEHGFLEAAGPLINALEHDSEHGRVLYLEELCLRSNKLNAVCLPALAHAIRLAASHLRDLDLSDNLLNVTNSQDADAWQDFLESFRECRMLRRVDLSGNALGTKAFEVLARVYSTEPEIDQSWEDDGERPQPQATGRHMVLRTVGSISVLVSGKVDGRVHQTQNLLRRLRKILGA
ncbi:MAG: hypothetical protein Q9193_000937 [Seirophora villosa]